MKFSSLGFVFEECQMSYWSGSRPIDQPSTVASKRFLSMKSEMNAAHSMGRMPTSIPTSFRRCWMITQVLRRSAFPLFVMISNRKGLPFLSRIPSPFVSFHPASASSVFAFAGSCG